MKCDCSLGEKFLVLLIFTLNDIWFCATQFECIVLVWNGTKYEHFSITWNSARITDKSMKSGARFLVPHLRSAIEWDIVSTWDFFGRRNLRIFSAVSRNAIHSLTVNWGDLVVAGDVEAPKIRISKVVQVKFDFIGFYQWISCGFTWFQWVFTGLLDFIEIIWIDCFFLLFRIEIF